MSMFYISYLKEKQVVVAIFMVGKGYGFVWFYHMIGTKCNNNINLC
jgi:hypothetical protein